MLSSLGLNLFLWQAQGPLGATAVAQSTGNAAAQATLIQVLAERQGELATQQAQGQAAATSRADLAAAQVAQQATADALQQELTALQVALAGQGTPTTGSASATPPLEPLVRLVLSNNALTTVQVGQPIDLIGSASHPEGIASFSVAVNGESLLNDAPFDVRLHTAAVRYVPRAPGEYRFSLLAITTSGRAAPPATLTVQVIAAERDINDAIRDQIQQNVSDLRGLPLLDPIFPTLLTRAELTERLQAETAVSLDRAELAREAVVLSAFDFVPPGYDLYEAMVPFLSAAVAGYYEPETKQFIVVSEGQTMTQEEQLTYAHEFMHALQDQHFQLALLGGRQLSHDARLALRALGEGEAELIEFLYRGRGYLTGETLDESEFIYGTPEFSNAPDFLVSDFNFPYTRGADFVYALYNNGGFEPLTAAWQTLPQSTEQILHPEKYLAVEAPLPVQLPPLTNTLGADWRWVQTDVFGEFYVREYLSLYLPTADSVTAAAGWGGDQYHVFQQDGTGAVAMALEVAWDTPADAAEFAAAFATFAQNRGGELIPNPAPNPLVQCWSGTADVLCLWPTATTTRITRAPDLPTALAGMAE